MNTLNVRLALTSMAYVELQHGYWVKPVGFQTFAYHETQDKWVSAFYSMVETVEVYESHTGLSTSENPLNVLKGWEAYTRTNIIGGGERSHFEIAG